MEQESAAHLPADPWREHFKLFDLGCFFLIPLSPPFLLLLDAASPSVRPLPRAPLLGTQRQGSLQAALTGCLHTHPSFTPSRRSRYVCTPPLLSHMELFLTKSKGNWMSVGRESELNISFSDSSTSHNPQPL